MSKRLLGVVASVFVVALASLLLVRAATPQQITTSAYVATPMTVRVTSDQHMTGSSLTPISGLAWTLPSLPTAQAYSFHCAGSYNQPTTAALDQFGLEVTPAVSNWEATAVMQTSVSTPSAFRGGVAETQTTTSAKAVVSGTPTVNTDLTWRMEGTIENPASQSVTVSVVYAAGGGNSTTIYRGSFCAITP